jgi:non-specific serine/threonine protein kinase/serine/threonine-protein kinase
MSVQARSEESIFCGALECATPAARAAYLHRACGDDVTLRAQVEILLRTREANADFLAGAAVILPDCAADEAAADAEATGSHIGRYKLLERIGEGGFGTVYVAEQAQPVRRRVALKIIKLGMDTKQVIARFEAERQALAMMDHPNIARVFDAGATDTGRPFFVMEHVRGVPITRY